VLALPAVIEVPEMAKDMQDWQLRFTPGRCRAMSGQNRSDERREGRGSLPAEQRRQEVQAARCVKRLAAFNRKRRQLDAVAAEYERHEHRRRAIETDRRQEMLARAHELNRPAGEIAARVSRRKGI
jgi:hypothetical protein